MSSSDKSELVTSNHVIAVAEQRREKPRALKQAIMQELLTGKTRLVESQGTNP